MAASIKKISVKLLTESKILSIICNYAVTEDYKIRLECIYVLGNLCAKSGKERGKILIEDFNCLRVFIISLEEFYTNEKLIKLILFALDNLFYIGSRISGLKYNFIVK